MRVCGVPTPAGFGRHGVRGLNLGAFVSSIHAGLDWRGLKATRSRDQEFEALPHVARAFAAQPGVRCAGVVFDRPVAEEFLQSAWRNGSPSQSVGEESQYEFLPLFTYLASTFLKATPELQRWAIRINPLRGGPDTILRVLEAALADSGFRSAADRSGDGSTSRA